MRLRFNKIIGRHGPAGLLSDALHRLFGWPDRPFAVGADHLRRHADLVGELAFLLLGLLEPLGKFHVAISSMTRIIVKQ